MENTRKYRRVMTGVMTAGSVDGPPEVEKRIDGIEEILP